MDHPLRTFRYREGLTVQGLALRVDTSKSTISRIENRREQNLHANLLRRIYEVTGGAITPNDVLELHASTRKERSPRRKTRPRRETAA